MSKIITYTEARGNLKTYLDYVIDNHDPVIITRKNGKEVVMISKEDYESMDETDYLLSTKTNRERLLATIEEEKSDNNDGSITFDSIDDLKKHYGI